METLGNVLWIVAFVVLAFVLLAAEVLDWIGRFEIIEKRWPRVWSAINNRPMRLVAMLLMCIVLVRDVSERLKELKIPALVVTVLPPPPPIITIVQPEKLSGLGSSRETIKQGGKQNQGIVQHGNNNQANPVIVNAPQTTHGTDSPIVNGSNNNAP